MSQCEQMYPMNSPSSGPMQPPSSPPQMPQYAPAQQRQQGPQQQQQQQEQQRGQQGPNASEQQTTTALETSYVMQNGKPVRVVRVVHYVQAPNNYESLTPQQQQQLLNEARSRFQTQQHPGQQQQQQQQQQLPYGAHQCGVKEMRQTYSQHYDAMYAQQPPAHTTKLGVTHTQHTAWPANPSTAAAGQRPTLGCHVMLRAGEPGDRSALRLGEVGVVVEDDGGFVPFCVRGPRGDVDYYAEHEVTRTGERQLSKERQLLGDQIFARVVDLSPTTAAKVTGMLLDGLNEGDLAALLSDHALLCQRVKDAHAILERHYSSQQHVPKPQALQPLRHIGGAMGGHQGGGAAGLCSPGAGSSFGEAMPPLQARSPQGMHAMREDDVSMTSPSGFSFDTPSFLNASDNFAINSPLVHPQMNEIPTDFPLN